MKRLKMAIALLILIPALIFMCHIYLKNVTDSMGEVLYYAEQDLQQGKNKEAANQLAAFNNKWEHNKGILATFIKHSELDTVNLAVAKLKPYLNDGDKGEFCAESEALRVQLHHIWESEKFSIDNVL